MRMRLDIVHESVRVFAHPEEVRLFLFFMHRAAADRAFVPVNQLRLCIERLALGTVHAVVRAEINVALIIEPAENLLHLLLMVFICRADKAVIGSVHQIPDFFDLASLFIDKGLRCHMRLRRTLLDFLAVFIRTCLEVHVIAVRSLPSGNTVRHDDFVRIADMRLSGRVGDRCRNIIFSLILHIYPFSCRAFVLST